MRILSTRFCCTGCIRYEVTYNCMWYRYCNPKHPRTRVLLTYDIRTISTLWNSFNCVKLIFYFVRYAGIDYIAMVGKYPEADEKIRTTSLSVHGGGNCGNTLTAMSRLGHKTSILSKVGLDAHGGMISEGLKAEGINTSNLVQKPNITTGLGNWSRWCNDVMLSVFV